MALSGKDVTKPASIILYGIIVWAKCICCPRALQAERPLLTCFFVPLFSDPVTFLPDGVVLGLWNIAWGFSSLQKDKRWTNILVWFFSRKKVYRTWRELWSVIVFEFPLVPGSAHARPSTQPPIKNSGNFLGQTLYFLWLKTPCKISEPYNNHFWEKSNARREREFPLVPMGVSTWGASPNLL